MKTLVFMLLLVAMSALGADQPGDGIYRRARGEPAAWTMSQDGQKLLLGKRQELKILTSELASRSNANDSFHLYVTIPYDEHLDPGSYILMVAGTAYRQMGSGASGKESSSISFYISAEENARQVSRYLGTPIAWRKHPQHHLLTSFTPTRREFAIGDEVTATLRITNIGSNTVSFMKGGRNRAERDNQYVFSARYNGRQVEDIGTSHHFGGLAAKRVLKPGQVFEDVISLSKWFAFGKAGIYEIHGAYYLDLNDPEGDAWKTVWEDYVSADFLVTVKGP